MVEDRERGHEPRGGSLFCPHLTEHEQRVGERRHERPQDELAAAVAGNEIRIALPPGERLVQPRSDQPPTLR